MSKKKRTAARRVTAALVALVVALMPFPTGGVALADGYPTSGKVELRDIRYGNSVTTPDGEATWRQPRVGDMSRCTVTIRNTSMNPLNKTDAESGLTAILTSLGLDDGQGWDTLTFTAGGRQTSSSGSSVSLNWNSGLRYNYTTDAIEVVLPVTEEVLESATVGGGALEVTVDRSFLIEPKIVSIAGMSPAEGQSWADVLPVFKEGDEVTVEMALENTGNVACTDGVVGMSAGWPESAYVESAGDTCYRPDGDRTPIGTLEPGGTTTVSVTFPWRAVYDDQGITFFMGTEYADADGAPWVTMSGNTGVYRSMLAHTAEAPTVSVRRVGDASKPVLNGDTVTFALDFSVPEGNTVGFRVPSPSFNGSLSGYRVGYGTDGDPFSVTWSNDVVAPGDTRSVYVSFTAADGHAGPSDGIVRLDTRDECDCHSQTVDASGVALEYDPNPMAAEASLRWSGSPSQIWSYGEGVVFPGRAYEVVLGVDNTGACDITATSSDFVMPDGTPADVSGTVPAGQSEGLMYPGGPYNSGIALRISPTEEQVEAGEWKGTVTISAEGKGPVDLEVSIPLVEKATWWLSLQDSGRRLHLRAGDVVELSYAATHTNNVRVSVADTAAEELDKMAWPTYMGDPDPVESTWELVGDPVLPVGEGGTSGTVWTRKVVVTQKMIEEGAYYCDQNHGVFYLERDPAVAISAKRLEPGSLREGEEAEFEVVISNTGNRILGDYEWSEDKAPAITVSVNGVEAARTDSDSWGPGETRTFRVSRTVTADDVARGWMDLDFSAEAACPWSERDEGTGRWLTAKVASNTVHMEVPVGILAAVMPETGGPGTLAGMLGAAALASSAALRLRRWRRRGGSPASR